MNLLLHTDCLKTAVIVFKIITHTVQFSCLIEVTPDMPEVIHL